MDKIRKKTKNQILQEKYGISRNKNEFLKEDNVKVSKSEKSKDYYFNSKLSKKKFYG